LFKFWIPGTLNLINGSKNVSLNPPLTTTTKYIAKYNVHTIYILSTKIIKFVYSTIIFMVIIVLKIYYVTKKTLFMLITIYI